MTVAYDASDLLVRGDPGVEFFSLVAANSVFVLIILLLAYALSLLR